jgi:magnesium chelatase subunit I
MLGGADLNGLLDRFDRGATVDSGEMVPAAELLHRIGPVTGLSKILESLGMEGESPGHAAAALEFALEGLYLMRRLSKDVSDGTSTYRT